MRGLIVFQSKWGNARQIAGAISNGLSEAGHEVEVARLPGAGDPAPGLEFLVIGGPTRMGRVTGPIKKYIKAIAGGGWTDIPFAAFSTGYTIHANKPSKQASEIINETLEAAGLVPLALPLKASVEDMHGPLSEGELERAEEYGRELGAKLSTL